MSMATKSFLKQVELKDKRLAEQFVDALEDSIENSSESYYGNEKQLDIKCTELTGESIKMFFNAK